MAFGSSMKDRAILAGLGVTALYAVGGMLWFMALTDKASGWNASRKQYRAAHEKYLRECKLISERNRWNEAYDDEREKMPIFAEGEVLDTHWLDAMDSIAEKCHVSIATRQPGAEQAVGDVFEVPIEVKNWEAGLEPLVRFLYGLEQARESMFDIKSISIRPSSHKGFLKGQFTLTCAYMRGDEAAEEAPEQAPKAPPEKVSQKRKEKSE